MAALKRRTRRWSGGSMSDLEPIIAAYRSGRLSRQDFVRRLLTLGVGLAFIEFLIGMPVRRALAANERVQVPARTPRLVLVVLDAFRFDYQQLAPMPNLGRLMQRGSTFTNAWVGQLESVTPASHATISTGATPSRQGIMGFSWRDPTTKQEVYGGWYDEVLAGRLEQQMLSHNVNSIPQAVKAVDSTARVVALSSEKYYAADAMGGPAADYIIYGLPDGATIAPRGIPHHVPPAAFLANKALSRKWPLHYGQYDELAMTMALHALHAFDPRVLMINLPGCDTYGHSTGGPNRPDVMSKLVTGVDRQLGRLVKAYSDRGVLDGTIFVITGDHGMVPNTYQVEDTVIKDAIRAAGGDYLFHTGGSAAFIWLRNPETAPTVAQHLANTIPHVRFAHYQSVQGGGYTYHGVSPTGQTLNPALEAAQQYLLSTCAGPLAPDITLTLVENMVVRNRLQGNSSSAHGNHSGTTWGVQHIPLVMAGPGIKPGAVLDFPARLMDIAPTALTLMGIRPDQMDGIQLSDALLRPTPDGQRAADELAPRLAAYQRSLSARSAADIQQQEAANNTP
jgi:arylsulfatase A-like enzyme